MSKWEQQGRKTIDGRTVRGFLRSLPASTIFTVTFIRRTDNKLRRMVCRRDVRKHLKGGTSTTKNDTRLQTVYDMQSQGYRCFDVTRVVHIKAGPVELKVSGFNPATNKVETASVKEEEPEFAGMTAP